MLIVRTNGEELPCRALFPVHGALGFNGPSLLPSAAVLDSRLAVVSGRSERSFRIFGVWHGLLRWIQFSDTLRTIRRTEIHYTMVGIAYYFFVQLYLDILTTFHNRMSHTVELV